MKMYSVCDNFTKLKIKYIHSWQARRT